MLYRNLVGIAENIDNARDALGRGDYEGAAALFARSAGGIAGTISSARETFRFARAAATLDPQIVRGYLQACFAAGTPILWEHGSKAIETFAPGERVWARNEFESDGPLELKEIEEIFTTQAEIYHLHAGGQVIRTTAEHPFWVQGKGWIAAKRLESGDLLVGHDGQQTPVEEVFATGEIEQVYNFRIADYHTYYVGDVSWGWSAWAHNLCHSRILGKALEGTGKARPSAAHQAAHIVPTGAWTGRSADIQRMIAETRATLAKFRVGIDSSRNGLGATAAPAGVFLCF